MYFDHNECVCVCVCVSVLASLTVPAPIYIYMSMLGVQVDLRQLKEVITLFIIPCPLYILPTEA